MNSLVRFLTRHKHEWDEYNRETGYIEPHDSRTGSDWLPTKGTYYRCRCGLEKRVFTDDWYSHREATFVFDPKKEHLSYKHLVSEVRS